MNEDDFIIQLSKYIKAAFAHEEKFIADLLQLNSDNDLHFFYMASEMCKVVAINARSGQFFTTTIKTQDFLNWYEQNKET